MTRIRSRRFDCGVIGSTQHFFHVLCHAADIVRRFSNETAVPRGACKPGTRYHTEHVSWQPCVSRRRSFANRFFFLFRCVRHRFSGNLQYLKQTAASLSSGRTWGHQARTRVLTAVGPKNNGPYAVALASQYFEVYCKIFDGSFARQGANICSAARVC